MRELRAVSVSLGAPSRDFRRVLEGDGFRLTLLRVGTGGDLRAAGYAIRHFDGNSDAIGLGGVNLAYRTGGFSVSVAAGRWLAGIARYTPVVDGSGVKSGWETEVPELLARRCGLGWDGARVLVLSALDRWGLAQALARAGAELRIADPVVALGLPLSFASLDTFSAAAHLALPLLALLPLPWLYPNARRAGRRGLFTWLGPRAYVRRLFDWATVIAGDLHFLYQVLPGSLHGQTIVTSGLDQAGAQWLQELGAGTVVSMNYTAAGPVSANLLEAAWVALAGRGPQTMAACERERYARLLGLEPRVWARSGPAEPAGLRLDPRPPGSSGCPHPPQ